MKIMTATLLKYLHDFNVCNKGIRLITGLGEACSERNHNMVLSYRILMSQCDIFVYASSYKELLNAYSLRFFVVKHSCNKHFTLFKIRPPTAPSHYEPFSSILLNLSVVVFINRRNRHRAYKILNISLNQGKDVVFIDL